ncbi:MAG: hypothetical protein R2698_02810 [Microthrixaceae bacterium]
MGRQVVAPQRLHGLDVLSGALAARPVLHPVMLHLVAVPTEADTHHEPTIGQVLQRRRGLRRDDRIALGDEQDAGSQEDRSGPYRRGGEGDEGVHGAAVLLRELVLARGGWGDPGLGDVGVLGQVERLEAAGLRLHRQLVGPHRPIGGEHRDAETHRVTLRPGWVVVVALDVAPIGSPADRPGS